MNPHTKKLDGKVAVVTGASKGIGAGIAKHLAAEGAAVVVNYSSSKEGADKVVDEITKRDGKAIAVQANVAKKKDIERLFAEAKKAFGRLEILVNRTLAKELGPRKIRVNAINPGMVITEGVVTGGFDKSDFRKQLESQTPLGRIGQTEDIAPAAVFLASQDSAWITGETLVIAGGLR
jgi:NAD(P)-dependent dehydrogenase (short-subunit alcohol dehydrogenase family)